MEQANDAQFTKAKDTRSITMFEDWLPRTVAVVVGTTQEGARNLVIEELVIAKRDTLVKIVFKNLEIVSLIQPMLEAVRARNESNKISAIRDNINMVEMAEKAESLIFRLLSEQMTHICCLALDTKLNRQRAGLVTSDLATNQETGETYSAEFYDWIKNNLTIRQEQEVIRAIIQVNDFVGLLKNYWTLVSTTSQEATARA